MPATHLVCIPKGGFDRKQLLSRLYLDPNDRASTEMIIPTTNLRMIYEVARTPKFTQSASSQITRGQEV